jgi:hypothetical protein
MEHLLMDWEPIMTIYDNVFGYIHAFADGLCPVIVITRRR